jgi:hypothetical protein
MRGPGELAQSLRRTAQRRPASLPTLNGSRDRQYLAVFAPRRAYPVVRCAAAQAHGFVLPSLSR